MKITIESTSKIVTLKADTNSGNVGLECRVWEGHTDSGIAVSCLIPRIAASTLADTSQFENELQEQKAPSAEIETWPLRMIL